MGFYLAFRAIPLWGLISGGTLTAFAVGAILNTIAVAVAVPALLSCDRERRSPRNPSRTTPVSFWQRQRPSRDPRQRNPQRSSNDDE